MNFMCITKQIKDMECVKNVLKKRYCVVSVVSL